MNKEFLDIDGLRIYTDQILELIEKKADSSLIETEIATLQALIGDINLLGENYKNVVIALLAEVERAKLEEQKITSSLSWGVLGEK